MSARNATELVERIWAKLTEDVPCCTCCESDQGYIAQVNEVGKLIDGRTWNGKPVTRVRELTP